MDSVQSHVDELVLIREEKIHQTFDLFDPRIKRAEDKIFQMFSMLVCMFNRVFD